MDKLKFNNKGITLVELLIAMAIGTIVISAVIILLNNGINSYSRQTITSQLQNDANITLNQMTDAIMEAKCIDIYNRISATGDTPNFITKRDDGKGNGNAYSYDKTNKILCVGPTPILTGNYTQSGMLCKNVESFKVQILNSSLKTEEITETNEAGVVSTNQKIIGINNPIQIKVTLKLNYNGIEREVSRVTSLRNEIKNVADFAVQNFTMTDFPLKSHIAGYFTD
ncbi:PilW family protein [[Clostridium] fimetarium]|uniref:Prepilin-type N-terminal cleavage/methylation domain-containing protein n=1 Tax=[Clostridium] fimetarium TaxID=99656 RepID=A0A1I0N0P6_9FIRM|nr:prepilin-type N-terminal cleavage/methylation domain-containing protein [[Clostridium] fimetarium]SEV94489.1 prepilin-type N-terminal cleavage/methylation domain-containing protein [[Clostridium] fimetarium]